MVTDSSEDGASALSWMMRLTRSRRTPASTVWDETNDPMAGTLPSVWRSDATEAAPVAPRNDDDGRDEGEEAAIHVIEDPSLTGGVSTASRSLTFR